MSAADIGNAAIREAVQTGLEKCTQPQRDFFVRIYPVLPDSKLAEAYDLIERTLRKNGEGRS